MENKIKFYLIDYENVHENGLQGYQELSCDDHVIIFCSQNAHAINGTILAFMQKRGIDFQIKAVQASSKNAMDFQIATEVGRLIGENHDGHKCIIISNDQGFLAVKVYWKAENVLVSIQPSIKDFLALNNTQVKTVKEINTSSPQPTAAKSSSKTYPFMEHKDFYQCVRKLSFANKEKEMAFQLFRSTKKIKDPGKRKQMLHGILCQAFGSDKGLVLYSSIKQILQ